MKYNLAIGLLVLAVAQTEAAVNVTLYYESLCIDCVLFIKNQMFPTYRDLGDNLKMDFVPFGKASWTENPWSIRCQHGDRECHGNAIQACALERYKKPEMQVKFVSCVMSEPQPDKAGATCAKRLGYSYEGIENCALGQEGRQLHMKHGRRTKNFRPVISYIPTVAFNDVYNARDQQMSMYQFKQVVCSKFPPGQIPPGCRNVNAPEEPIEEQPKEEQPNEEQPREEQPKEEQPNEEQPKEEQPKEEQPNEEQPKEEQPKEEQPNEEQPKEEQPKEEQPNEEQPKEEQPKEEQPKEEQPKEEQPKEEQPEKEQPKEEQPEWPTYHHPKIYINPRRE